MLWLTWLLYNRATTGEGPAVLPGFLLIILVKGLFFSSGKDKRKGEIELTRSAHPKLFALIDELCSRTGAPKPRKVLLNGQVSAAVITPLTLHSFLPGGPKDLLIGAPLFESLNVSEMSAVVAHELGHFSQKTTALGRWVYLSSMAGQRLVEHRDAIDDTLEALSKAVMAARYSLSIIPMALLLSAVGWLFRGIVWAVRFWVRAAYFIVAWAHRQLSQEMEFHADLVSVAAVGSNALPQALYKVTVADRIWEEVLDELTDSVFEGKYPPNLTLLQRQLLQNQRYVLDDVNFGTPPPPPATGREAHRIFETQLVESPRQWATHPPNNAREANAKRIFVASEENTSSSWELIESPEALQKQVTVEMVKQVPVRGQVLAMSEEEALEKLNQRYRHEALHPRYKGRFLRGSLGRLHGSPESLGHASRPQAGEVELASVYPENYRTLLRRLDNKLSLRAQLVALRFGADKNRMHQLHGKSISPRALGELFSGANSDVRQIQSAVTKLDRSGREAFLSVAHELGQEWEAYYRDLIALAVLSAHQSMALERAISTYHSVVGSLDMSKEVKTRDRHNLTAALCYTLQVMQVILEAAPELELPALVSQQLGRRWQEILPPHLPISQPEPDSVFDSVDQCEKWMRIFSAACMALEHASQDALLLTEKYFAECLENSEQPGAAPERGKLPSEPIQVETNLAMTDIPEPTWSERIRGWLGPAFWGARAASAAAILFGVLAIMFDW